MKLVTFRQAGELRLGAQIPDRSGTRLADLARSAPGIPADVIGLLAAGPEALEAARDAIARPERCVLVDPGEVRLAAPVPRPGKILCLGHNYRDHMGKDRTAPPEYPNIFCKTWNCVIGPEEAIVIPPETQRADFEAELAVVIGRRARRVAEQDAGRYVAGYTIFNDVSARDVQQRGSQWMLGKSIDTFGPMGPALVTADEIPDPHNLALELTVNGTVRQSANTRDQIFSVPFLVAYLSALLTLEPGDVIATGTPARIPPPEGMDPYLKPGDTVSIGIDGLGRLTNPIEAE